MQNDNDKVELMEPEVVETQEITEAVLKDEGMSAPEIALAKKHNLIKEEKDGEHDGKSDDASGEDDEANDDGKVDEQNDAVKDAAKAKQETLNIDSLDSFEKVHELFENKPDQFRKLPANIKALYHNSKGLYKKAKVEEQRRQEIEKKSEFEALRNKGAEMKLSRVRELLKKDGLTVDELQAVIEDAKAEVVPAPEPKKEEVNQELVVFAQDRIQEAEKLGKTEYDDFETIVAQAGEVCKDKPVWTKFLQDSLFNKDISERELVDIVVDIAKLHKNYGKSSKDEKPAKADENVERMLKNSQKKASSASVSGGTGNRSKTYDELTPEDVLRMSNEQYSKLPKTVRDRLKAQL